MKRILLIILLIFPSAAISSTDAANSSCISNFCLASPVTDKVLVAAYGPGLLTRYPQKGEGHVRCYYLAQPKAWVELHFNSPDGEMTGVVLSRSRQCAKNHPPKQPMAADLLNGRIRLGMSPSELLGVLGTPSQTIRPDSADEFDPIMNSKLGDAVQIYLRTDEWCYLVYLKNGVVDGLGMMPSI